MLDKPMINIINFHYHTNEKARNPTHSTITLPFRTFFLFSFFFVKSYGNPDVMCHSSKACLSIRMSTHTQRGSTTCQHTLSPPFQRPCSLAMVWALTHVCVHDMHRSSLGLDISWPTSYAAGVGFNPKWSWMLNECELRNLCFISQATTWWLIMTYITWRTTVIVMWNTYGLCKCFIRHVFSLVPHTRKMHCFAVIKALTGGYRLILGKFIIRCFSETQCI